MLPVLPVLPVEALAAATFFGGRTLLSGLDSVENMSRNRLLRRRLRAKWMPRFLASMTGATTQISFRTRPSSRRNT